MSRADDAPRHERLRGAAQALRGTLLLLLAVPCLLPIPFGNLLPAMSLTALGPVPAFRDGAAMGFGGVSAALALLFTAGLGLAARHRGVAGLLAGTRR